MAPVWHMPTPCPQPPPRKTNAEGRPCSSRSSVTVKSALLSIPNRLRMVSSPRSSVAPSAPETSRSRTRPDAPACRRVRVSPRAPPRGRHQRIERRGGDGAPPAGAAGRGEAPPPARGREIEGQKTARVALGIGEIGDVLQNVRPTTEARVG